MTTPDSTPATVEGVMSIAFELARIREQHGAQSGVYLSKVRALRAEVERIADIASLILDEGRALPADQQAEGIAAHLGVDIGEHTAGAGANNPWANALEAIQAVAQSAPLAQQAREYPPLPKLPTMTVLSELQSGTQEMVRLDVAHEAMRAYVDADRAAAQVEPPAGRVIPADGEVRG